MKRRRQPIPWTCRWTPAAAAIIVAVCATPIRAADPLPSWNDGVAKHSIVTFVDRVCRAGPDFVPPAERIAVFDNDGTLWCEKPYYTQLAFAFDRLRALAADHPEWREKQPFKAALENDLKKVLAGPVADRLTLFGASHAGMTTEEFEIIVNDWIAQARHPRFKRGYTDLSYQPMLEVLAYLRDREFKAYIVSGGGVEFMRPWSERVYGIPPERVIGSSIKLAYTLRADKPEVLRLPEIAFIDDKEGKPVGIQRAIGRRPLMAFGNSDGDYEMLLWTTTGPGRRFGLIVHHTDADREYAYDKDSAVGRLDKALAESASRGWTVADMKKDWNQVFPPEKKPR